MERSYISRDKGDLVPGADIRFFIIQSLGKGEAQDRRPGLVRDLQRTVEPVGDREKRGPDQIASRLKGSHLHLDPAGHVLALLVSEQAVTGLATRSVRDAGRDRDLPR